MLIGLDSLFSVSPNPEMMNVRDSLLYSNPYYRLLQLQAKYSEALVVVEKNKILPDIALNYFVGTNFADNAKYYHGFQAGLGFPIFYKGQKARVKASKISLMSQLQQNEYELSLLEAKQATLKNEQEKYRKLLEQFNASGRQLYDEIIRTALKSYQSGEIDFFRFVMSYENAIQLKTDYLDNLQNFNMFALELKYLAI
jgi:cobalt-zinc-cadmium resistance protein CzcA